MPKPKSDILTPDALPELLSRGISGVFVFFGDEDYLKTVWLERIAKTVMSAEGFELFNRFSVSFSDEKKGLSQLADALFASPMMQDKTLVEVHDLSLSLAKPSTLDLLCSSLSVASEDTVAIVIFRADELEADYRFSQSPIYKKLSAVSTLVKFDALPDGKLEAWAKKLLSAKKLFLRDDAAKLLVGMCSGKMMNIFGETEKLAAYKKYSLGGSIEITAEDVGEVCCQSAKDEAPFAMSDAASKWNLREMTSALSMCRDLQEEPVAVVAKLGKIYVDMLKIKTALVSGQTVTSAAKSLGMNEYRAKLLAQSVSAVPVAVIENALLLTYETDVKLKSTQTDKWVLIDRLAASIYTPKSLREAKC